MSINPNSGARIIIGPCGACKFLRKRCPEDCIFAPYFYSDQGIINFAAVHKIFGTSNLSKLLMTVPIPKRNDAVLSLCLEAHARLQDPIYGCVSQICALKDEVHNLETQISWLQAYVATQLPPQQHPQSSLSMSDFPGATYHDTSSPFEFDPNIGSSQQQIQDQNPFARAPVGGGGSGGGGEELERVARDVLLRRQRGRKRVAQSMPPSPN